MKTSPSIIIPIKLFLFLPLFCWFANAHSQCSNPSFFGNDTLLCAGETLLLDATYPGSTYLWQDASTNATFLADTPGLFWVEVTEGICIYRDSIVVNYDTLPNLDLGPPTTKLCPGEVFIIDATTPNTLS